MKITANRREDIEKARAEYDAKTKELSDKYDAQQDEYHTKVAEQTKAMEQRISDEIGSTSLDMSIRVDPYRSFGIGDKARWGVRIEVNESKHFDENVGLIWHWEAMIDADGNVKKETGSWSGLNAVTESQVADLEESVRVIKILNNMNWEDILNSPRAQYSDYIDPELRKEMSQRKYARPQFEDQLVEAQLEELVGGDVAVKLSEDQYWNGEVWILPTGITDKFIKGYIFPQYYLSDKSRKTIEDIKNGSDLRRTSRNKIVLRDGNLVTIDLNDR